MHEIQKQVLKTLTFGRVHRYSDLRPQNVEGNRFAYHISVLKKEGYIRSEDGKYFLTTKGKRYVDRVSLKDFSERIQPKIVTLVALKNSLGEYLLYRRKRVPFIRRVGFPYGKIHLGETIHRAAERELKEKTGYGAYLVHCGDVYVTAIDGHGEIISQMYFHVFSGKHPRGVVKQNPEIGECFWGNPTEISNQDQMPGLKEILFLTQSSKTHFFWGIYHYGER